MKNAYSFGFILGMATGDFSLSAPEPPYGICKLEYQFHIFHFTHLVSEYRSLSQAIALAFVRGF